MLGAMKRSEFNEKHKYRVGATKGSENHCGNCRHYLTGQRTLAVGCGLMLQYMMTHGEIVVNRMRGVCDLWQEVQGKPAMKSGRMFLESGGLFSG
jgi:hypothetical protein